MKHSIAKLLTIVSGLLAACLLVVLLVPGGELPSRIVAAPESESEETKSSPSQRRVARAQLRRERSQVRRMQRFWASPRARAERQSSRKRFNDLGRSAALAAAQREHPAVINQPTWRPPTLRAGDRPVGFLSSTTQRIDVANQKADAIVDSPQDPIATMRGGKFVPFDLSLRKSGSGWTPEVADLQTQFPRDLSEGITAELGGDFGKLSIRPAADSDDGVPVGERKKLFYANALADTDVVAEAAPRGGEISWVLRSRGSPESLPLDIAVGDHSKRITLVDGGAVVEADGRPLISIRPPKAADAQGKPVPVAYELRDGALDVVARHQTSDFAYPIVVDPYYVINGVPAFREVNADNVMPVSCVFGSWTDNTIRATMWTSAISSGCRHFSQWANATRGGPWHAKWVYDAPNASTIFRSEWGDVSMENNASNRSDVIVGIANGPLTAWEGNYWLAANPWHSTVTVCANAACNLAGSADNRAQFVHRITLPSGVALPSGQSPKAWHIGTVSFFSDYENPGLSGVPAVSTQWQKPADPTLTATDGGVGLSHGAPGQHAGLPAIRVLADGVQTFGNGPVCGGGVTSPCQVSYSSTVPLQDGNRTYNFSSSDIVGRTTTHTRQLKIDRSGPEIDLGGRFGTFALESTVLSTAGTRTVVKNAPFVIRATDGRAENATDGQPAPQSDRRSGVKSVNAKIYGSDSWGNINLNDLKDEFSGGNSAAQCDQNTNPSASDSCKLSLTGTFSAETLAPGVYYVRVAATDWLDNSTSKDFKVAVGVASLERVSEGRATARYVPVQVKRNNGETATTTSLQYRTKLNWGWCPVPSTALRPETSFNGSVTYPLPFDSNGLTETVVLDLDALRDVWSATSCLENSNRLPDGKVYLRGRLTGGTNDATRSSEDVVIRYERGGLGTDDETTELGPGTVDLMTGNFSMGATDVNVDAYKSDLTVSRTYNSRYAAGNPKIGPFGPGWTMGIESETMGTMYNKVVDNASVDIPEEERYAAVDVETTDGDFFTFELSESSNEYIPQAGLETLKLTRIPDAFDSNRTAGFKLFDKDTGSVTNFSTRPASAPANHYAATDTYSIGSSDAVTYAFGQSSTIGTYPTYAFAPSAGLSCRDADETATTAFDTLPRGCQALRFNYITPATGRRISSIDVKTFDPQLSGGSMRQVRVAEYSYDAQGRLTEAWDPRITPALKTTYTILADTDPRISAVKAPGEETVNLNYLKLTEDSTYGRLRSVSKPSLLPAPNDVATWNVRYYVPVHGAGAPYDMSFAETSKWGQERPPFMATAVFPPDQPPNGEPATNYDRASFNYLDPYGNEVNDREPGGRVGVTEYDKYGNVTRELSAENRRRAMEKPTAQERLDASERWDTKSFFEDVPNSVEGRRHLVRTIGPERNVRLDNGTMVNARSQTTYCFDEDRTPSEIASDDFGGGCSSERLPVDPDSSEPYDLMTSTRRGALVGSSPDGTDGTTHDVRTTALYYGTGSTELKMRVPRITVEDPGAGGKNLKRQSDLDSDGLEVAKYQPSSQSDSAPTTTRTIYYKAEPGECGDRPEWRGLPCKVFQGGQPTNAGLPKLPEKLTTYNYLRQPINAAETVVDAAGNSKSRSNSKTYDTAGRVLTEGVTSDLGEPVKQTEHIYSTTTGRETETRSKNSNGTTHKSVVRGYDSLGRQISYTDAEGHYSTTSYDLLSRVSTTHDGKAGRSYNYDAVTGDLTSVNDAGTASFYAEYDHDGRITATQLPGGMSKYFSYDASGAQTYLYYVKGNGCSSNCVVFENWMTENAHHQIREFWTRIKPQGQSLQESAYEFAYDEAGRLKRADDWRNDSGTWKCAVREYTLDANSNRTAKKSIAENDHFCDYAGSSTTESNTYDNADRMTNAGYAYDAFGRVTTTPQSGAGGTGDLTATYFANDRLRSLAQSGTIQTIDLDPNDRMSVKTKVTPQGTQVEKYAYTDDSDSPSWIETDGATWQRYVEGVAGVEGVQETIGSARYYFTDLRGDVVAEGYPEATSITRVDEFGVPKTELPNERRYAFHGVKQRESLTSSGVVAMGVRVYAPRTGRFMQPDPVLGGSANPYDYAYQDPVNIDDLQGDCPWCFVAGGLALRACMKVCPKLMKYAPRLGKKAGRKFKKISSKRVRSSPVEKGKMKHKGRAFRMTGARGEQMMREMRFMASTWGTKKPPSSGREVYEVFGDTYSFALSSTKSGQVRTVYHTYKNAAGKTVRDAYRLRP